MPTPTAGGEVPSSARHAPFARRGEPRRKAVPGDARRHNRALALRTVFRQGPLSRADLARETNLTRVTASDLAAELLSEGLIEELGTRVDQGVGKPATLLGVVPDARLTIAVDLSDDERFRAALVDLAGTILDRRTAARDGRTGPAALDLARELCLDLAGVADRPLLGVGVGSPGVVDPRGVVIEAPNLGWHDLELAAGLGRGLDAPVHVANDANAAALGELGLGGPAERSLLLVKVGHGVGAGLVLDGHLVLGDRFAAGEIGHVVVDPGGEVCACGRTGCLETAIAAPRLRRRARAGGPVAARTAAGHRLGEALAPVISTLNLREVVLSGPDDVLDETFRRAALDAIRARTMPAVGDNVDLRASSLGEDDVLLGAAMLVLDRELGVA
ncbi:MAG TPA: ROK family transcriptional regulator [Acidimicrobiales bacterium]|nr:ROK family transcriptional regulator [Acidimicrobiales bacterium]